MLNSSANLSRSSVTLGGKIISARELEEGNWGYRGGAGSMERKEDDGVGGRVWAQGGGRILRQDGREKSETSETIVSL